MTYVRTTTDPDSGKTFVSPHEYLDCDPFCMRRDGHCAAHCGYDKDEDVHRVTPFADGTRVA